MILLDLMLPGIMGEELIEQIREASEVPILVLSAKSSLEDRVNVLELGADDYLTKPFQREEVIARINSALRRYLRFGGKEGKAPDYDGNRTNDAICTDRAIEEVYEYKNLVLSVDKREVYVLHQPGENNQNVQGIQGVQEKTTLSLTAHEFDLLRLLMQNPGKVFSGESLYEQV